LTSSAVSVSPTHAMMSKTAAHSVLIGTGMPIPAAATAHLSCSLILSAQTACCLTTTHANAKKITNRALMSKTAANSVLIGTGMLTPAAATAHLSCSLTLSAQTACCLTTTHANVKKADALMSRTVAHSVLIGCGTFRSATANALL
jgi:hypothetical protein